MCKEKRSDYHSLEECHWDAGLISCSEGFSVTMGLSWGPQGPLVSASQTPRRPGRSSGVKSPVQGHEAHSSGHSGARAGPSPTPGFSPSQPPHHFLAGQYMESGLACCLGLAWGGWQTAWCQRLHPNKAVTLPHVTADSGDGCVYKELPFQISG